MKRMKFYTADAMTCNMNQKRLAAAVLFACYLASSPLSVFARRGYTLQSYPDFAPTNNEEDPKAAASSTKSESLTCGPSSFDRVCDPDELLSEDTRIQLQQKLFDIEHSPDTQLQCGQTVLGYQVAFAMASRMDSDMYDSAAEAAEAMARGLHDRWGVGHAECNDGIVLFISQKDRRMHISTGEGAKQVVTDMAVQAIIERMRPLLRKGDFSSALLQAAADLESLINPKLRATSPVVATMAVLEKQKREGTFFGFGVFAVFATAMMCISYFQNKRHRCETAAWEQARDRLRAIEQLRDEAVQQVAPTVAPQADVINEVHNTDDPTNVADTTTDTAGLRRRAGVDNAPGRSPTSIPTSTPVEPLAARMPCCPICLEDFPSTDAATSSPSSTVQSAHTTDRRILQLPCRHRFHEACIDQWFGGQRRNTCPVCRTPAFHNDGSILTDADVRDAQQPRAQDAARPAAGGAGDRNAQNYPRDGATGCTADAYPDPRPHVRYGFYDNTWDILFLLRSLHRRYPTYVTQTQLDTWARDPSRLSSEALSAAPAFVAAKPVLPSSSSGGKGRRSGRFGGGSSRGGGGGGGGW